MKKIEMACWAFACIPTAILIYLLVFGATEKVVWNLVDHVTKGALRVESYVMERKLKVGLMHYQTDMENLIGKLGRPEYTWEAYKEDAKGLMNQELVFVKIADRVITSYRTSGLVESD